MTEATFDCRNAWVQSLVESAANDPRIVVVVNDSVGSSKLGAFEEKFPERMINVGIAEQDMVGISAGLASSGRIPFVSAAGSFLSARATEQIKVDAAYAQNNIKLIAQSPGIAYGDLGPTHHSIEDMTWMRCIPNLSVVVPASPKETEEVIRWAAASEGPAYIRISRMKVPEVYGENYQYVHGKAVQLRQGDAATIIATGITVTRALAAADELEERGVSVRVLSMPTIKPLDREAVVEAARDTGAIVTVEEGLVTGLGGAVAEVVVAEWPVPMRFCGFHDEFAITGSTEWLLDQYGMNTANIIAQVESIVNQG